MRSGRRKCRASRASERMGRVPWQFGHSITLNRPDPARSPRSPNQKPFASEGASIPLSAQLVGNRVIVGSDKPRRLVSFPDSDKWHMTWDAQVR
jgi:hypothetical protein